MRKPGFCLAFVAIAATAKLVTFTTPAFADDTPAAATTTTTPPADGMVMVHINSVMPVTLQHRSGKDGAWADACVAPCNQRLPIADEYQITVPGGDTQPSKAFFLQAKSDKVTLEVAPGEKSKAHLGTALLVTGAIIAVAGVVVATAFAVGQAAHVAGAGDNLSSNSRTTGMWVGYAMIFGGVGIGAYGLGTNLANQHTLVGGDVQADQPARGTADPVVRAAQNKPQFVLPIFSASF